MTAFVIMLISGCESKLKGDVAYFGFNCGDEATVVEVERSNRRVHFEVIDTPAGIARTLVESPSWAEIIKFTPDTTKLEEYIEGRVIAGREGVPMIYGHRTLDGSVYQMSAAISPNRSDARLVRLDIEIQFLHKEGDY